MGFIDGFNYVLGKIADNLRFIVSNWVSHIVAGVFIATALYPFLNKECRKRFNYAFFVFIPAVFGSVFPDTLFIISTLIQHRQLAGLRYLLEHGGSIHAVFHKTVALALVIPTTVFVVLVLVYLVNWVCSLLGKEEFSFPSKWILLVSAISIFSSFLHIVMDATGWF